MLYARIIQVTLSLYALLSPRIHGSNYYVSTDPTSDYQCPFNTVSCHIYCDKADPGHVNTFECNDASNCFFHCDAKQCGMDAIINASNARVLTITQSSSGDKCLKDATITAPHNGSAYMSTQSKAGFTGIKVYAGSNTKEMVVDTTQGGEEKIGNEYTGMEFYAATAQYFRINIGPKLSWKTGVISCPINSKYHGPDPAPCMIDANGKMTDVSIVAPDGTPTNVIVSDGCDCSNVDLICDGFTDEYPFDTTDPCWWTGEPSQSPSKIPTAAPTKTPTRVPSNTPTTVPTNAPTTLPSDAPVTAPSNAPMSAATNAPTNSPINPTTTASPSNTPTTPSHGPTLSPSHIPSLSPSKEPSMMTSDANMGGKHNNRQQNNVFTLFGIDGFELISIALVVCITLVISCWLCGCHVKSKISAARDRTRGTLSVDPELHLQTSTRTSAVSLQMPSRHTLSRARKLAGVTEREPPAQLPQTSSQVGELLLGAKSPSEGRPVSLPHVMDDDSSDSSDMYNSKLKRCTTDEGDISTVTETGNREDCLFDIAMGHMHKTPSGLSSSKMQRRRHGIQRIKSFMDDEVELPEYTNAMIMNGYDEMENLMEITLDELKEIGVLKMGHRRKILKYISRLKLNKMDNDIFD